MIKQCAHEVCGQTFEAQRRDARYCSASCRAAASRARREGVGTESGPSMAAAPAEPRATAPVPSKAPAPVAPAPCAARQVSAWPEEDPRLRALEVKLVDLEADVAELVPLVKDVAVIRESAAERDDLYELERVIAGIDRRLVAVEERSVVPPRGKPDQRLDELENAVVALLRQASHLREEFNVLVDALAG